MLQTTNPMLSDGHTMAIFDPDGNPVLADIWGGRLQVCSLTVVATTNHQPVHGCVIERAISAISSRYMLLGYRYPVASRAMVEDVSFA